MEQSTALNSMPIPNNPEARGVNATRMVTAHKAMH